MPWAGVDLATKTKHLLHDFDIFFSTGNSFCNEVPLFTIVLTSMHSSHASITTTAMGFDRQLLLYSRGRVIAVAQCPRPRQQGKCGQKGVYVVGRGHPNAVPGMTKVGVQPLSSSTTRTAAQSRMTMQERLSNHHGLNPHLQREPE